MAMLGLGVAGCGDETTASDTSTPPTTNEPTTTSDRSTTPAEGPATFDVYLLPTEIGNDCSVVIPSERQAQVEGEVGDALSQLLAGPTEEELALGLASWFSEDTEGMLNGVVIEDGVAEVDFGDFSGIIPNASASCGSAALLAQLDNTVLQFPQVVEVVYSFDGDRTAFYEWLQLSSPD
jgi:spore germination protein GerM